MGLHTRTIPGKRVIITLHDGTVIVDRFVCRPKHNRWIELEQHGRVWKADIKSMANLKGSVDPKRLKGSAGA